MSYMAHEPLVFNSITKTCRFLKNIYIYSTQRSDSYRSIKFSNKHISKIKTLVTAPIFHFNKSTIDGFITRSC